MAKAFKCDRCNALKPGRPYQRVAWGPTPSSAMSKVTYKDEAECKDICEGCFRDMMGFFNE